jgi:hypothetical protein
MKSKLSIVSFVLVIISIFLLIYLGVFSVPIFGYGLYLIILSILFAFLGIIFGITSLVKMKNTNLTGKGYSITAIVLCILTILASVVLYMIARALGNVGLGI